MFASVRVLRTCPVLWSGGAHELAPLEPALWLGPEVSESGPALAPEVVRPEAARSPMSFLLSERVELAFDLSLLPASVSVALTAPLGDHSR